MKVDLYTTPAVFDILADEWDTLLDPRRSDNFFMSHDWQRTWWKHLGQGSLAVAALRGGDGVLRGIAPWFLTTEGNRRILRIVGCIDVSDYIDLILMPGYEEQTLDALFKFAVSNDAPTWDVIHICNLPEASPTMTHLPPLAAGYGLKVERTVEDFCPVITLPETYEDYLASLDKKQRHELRRKRRRAEEIPVRWYIVGQEHNLNDEIEAFLDLMAMSTPQKTDFLKQPGHREFFREMGRIMFERGMLEINFLTLEGRRVAAIWNFAYHDRMMLYNSGLNPVDFSGLSAGIVLLSFSIEDAVRRGFRKYDFLQGDEEYKYRMGAETTSVYNFVIRR